MPLSTQSPSTTWDNLIYCQAGFGTSLQDLLGGDDTALPISVSTTVLRAKDKLEVANEASFEGVIKATGLGTNISAIGRTALIKGSDNKVYAIPTNTAAGYFSPKSGWNDLDTYAVGSIDYGLPRISSIYSANEDETTAPRPKWRVHNHQVILSGPLVIPLADATATGDTNFYEEYTSGTNSVFSAGWNTKEVATTGSNWTVLTTASGDGARSDLKTGPLMSASELYPDRYIDFGWKVAHRPIRLLNTNDVVQLDIGWLTALVRVSIGTDGRLLVRSVSSMERHHFHGTNKGGTGYNSIDLRGIASLTDTDESSRVLNLGSHSAPNYSTTFDSQHAGNGDNRVPAGHDRKYPLIIDTNDAADLGGFVIDMDGMSYFLDNSLSVDQINAVID